MKQLGLKGFYLKLLQTKDRLLCWWKPYTIFW